MNDVAMISSAVPVIAKTQECHYSVEFFHIYTDEQIGAIQLKSLEYLKTVQKVWDIDASLIVLMDDYNPKEQKLTSQEVLTFLKGEGVEPRYWAFESDLVEGAKEFLGSITDKHLQKNYKRYIVRHGKLPCSLLTATWYLTRLGLLDTSKIKSSGQEVGYAHAGRLINILPNAYKTIEARAFELITKSPYARYTDNIQNLFYDADAGRALDLF